MSVRNNTRPKTKMEAQIWNKYTAYNKSWDFIPIYYWPNNLALATIQSRLKSKDRMQMFIYFVGNGMSPRDAREAILEMGVRYFDKSAIDNVYYLEKNIVQLSKKYDYWDELLEKRVLLNDTLVIENDYNGKYSYGKPQRIKMDYKVATSGGGRTSGLKFAKGGTRLINEDDDTDEDDAIEYDDDGEMVNPFIKYG